MRGFDHTTPLQDPIKNLPTKSINVGFSYFYMAYVKKVEVREFLRRQGLRAAGDIFDALDKAVEWKLKKAVERAKANGRKTVKGIDI